MIYTQYILCKLTKANTYYNYHIAFPKKKGNSVLGFNKNNTEALMGHGT